MERGHRHLFFLTTAASGNVPVCAGGKSLHRLLGERGLGVRAAGPWAGSCPAIGQEPPRDQGWSGKQWFLAEMLRRGPMAMFRTLGALSRCPGILVILALIVAVIVAMVGCL